MPTLITVLLRACVCDLKLTNWPNFCSSFSLVWQRKCLSCSLLCTRSLSWLPMRMAARWRRLSFRWLPSMTIISFEQWRMWECVSHSMLMSKWESPPVLSHQSSLLSSATRARSSRLFSSLLLLFLFSVTLLLFLTQNLTKHLYLLTHRQLFNVHYHISLLSLLVFTGYFRTVVPLTNCPTTFTITRTKLCIIHTQVHLCMCDSL